MLELVAERGIFNACVFVCDFDGAVIEWLHRNFTNVNLFDVHDWVELNSFHQLK